MTIMSLKVGNVLQVVPADFNGVQSTRRERSTAVTPTVRPGSNQVVRVGNVLQVVPTSLDWTGNQSSSTTNQSSGVLCSTVSAPSPSTSSVPTVPVPVPVPLPVPPAGTANTLPTMPTTGSLPLSLPVPVPVPIPISPAFSRNEVQQQSTYIYENLSLV